MAQEFLVAGHATTAGNDIDSGSVQEVRVQKAGRITQAEVIHIVRCTDELDVESRPVPAVAGRHRAARGDLPVRVHIRDREG